jgi:hypothetical protein
LTGSGFTPRVGGGSVSHQITFMHALEFLVNGQRVCVAAPGGDGLVMSNVVMTPTLSNPDKCCVHFRVGGVRDDQHLEWLRQKLSIGDTVEIRVVDAPQSDPPATIEPGTDAERERLRKASGDNAA